MASCAPAAIPPAGMAADRAASAVSRATPAEFLRARIAAADETARQPAPRVAGLMSARTLRWNRWAAMLVLWQRGNSMRVIGRLLGTTAGQVRYGLKEAVWLTTQEEAFRVLLRELAGAVDALIVIPAAMARTAPRDWRDLLAPVLKATDCPLTLIVGRGRRPRITQARHFAMAVLVAHGHSRAQVGRWLGGRDHTSVMHGLTRFAAICAGPDGPMWLEEFRRAVPDPLMHPADLTPKPAWRKGER